MAVGQKKGTPNGTLVSGNMDQNQRFSGGLILTHTHIVRAFSVNTARDVSDTCMIEWSPLPFKRAGLATKLNATRFTVNSNGSI